MSVQFSETGGSLNYSFSSKNDWATIGWLNQLFISTKVWLSIKSRIKITIRFNESMIVQNWKF
jgi:hypothetical protein